MTTSARKSGPDGPDSESRPEPVLKAALVPMATSIVGLLVAFGVNLDADQRNALLGMIGALVPLVGLAANWWARRQVTPVVSPRDDHGRVLAPVQPGLM